MKGCWEDCRACLHRGGVLRGRWVWAWLLCGLGVVFPCSAGAQSVQEGAAAPPPAAEEWTWFDRESGSPRPLPLADESSSAARHRASGWAVAPAAPSPMPAAPAGNAWAAWLSQGISTVVWGSLIALLFFLAMMVIRWMLRRDRELEDRFEVAGDESIDMTRIEELPFEVPATDGEFLERARKARQAGRLREATTLIYAYVLLQLDRRHWIQLARGKTNRQYLRELREAPAGIRDFLAQTIVVFEDAFFGDHPPSEEEFDRHWLALDEFRRAFAISGGET